MPVLIRKPWLPRASVRLGRARPVSRLVVPYAAAVAFTVAAAVARGLLLPLTGPGAPFLLFFGATLATSYNFGPGPGFLSAAVGAYLGPVYFGMRPNTAIDAQTVGQMALFLLEGFTVSWITHGFSQSRQAARDHADEMRLSEERYEIAARATLDCIWDWDLRTGTVAYSEAIHTVFGYPRTQHASHYTWWLDHIHPDDVERVQNSIRATFKERAQGWSEEYRFRTEAGVWLNVLDRGWVLYGAGSMPVRMIGAMQNVSQHRQGQRVLSEANARLRLITDALPALVAYLDQEGRHRFVSAEYERWFNRPRSAILGRTLDDFIGGNNARMRQNLQRALAGEHVRFEDTLRHPTRGTINTSNTFVPDFDEEGKVRGIVCLVHDVSEQKNIERVLRESEEHYRVLAEVVPQIIWEAKADGTFTYVNSQWMRYVGMPPAKAYGLGWLDAVHPSQRESLLARWRATESGEREWECEVLIRRGLDNAHRWHLLRALALTDGQGGVRKWIGSLIDIHEQRQAAQDLQTLANFLPQLAWVADGKGQISWFNQRWLDYTGGAIEQMRGDGWLQVVHPDHRPGVRRAFARALQDQAPFEGTFPMRSASGAWQWFLTRAIPITDEGGRITRWFGTSTDINEQLEVQNRLERAQLDLKTAVRARDQFLSIASHELKTPLTSLQLVAQMAERNLERNPERACEPPRVRKLVDQTGKSVARLTRLVDDMLDSSRIAMGKLSFKTEYFNLTELVHEVIERTQPQAQAHNSSIQVVSETDAWGNWDRFRLEQVVLNLLTNAIRYGENTPIEVRVDADGKRATLQVRDHGPGVAPGQEERIFQQFERATPHSSISGLGLGLFICKEIVERHGGTIHVDNYVGKGANFVVQLPCAPSSEQLAGPPGPHASNLPKTNLVA